MRFRYLSLGMLLCGQLLSAQDVTVRGEVTVARLRNGGGTDNSYVVVSLTPLNTRTTLAPTRSVRLLQKNKQFTPHLVAVTQGSTIEFPNQDPFFHDVFSIYHGKPFDLGLYEGGTVRRVVFSSPGISYIFCNIHPGMTAIVVVEQTPYFAVTGADGGFQISQVPAGKYKLQVWYEFASEEELASLSRQVEISSGKGSLGAITVRSSLGTAPHLNKYGEPYSPERTTY